VHVYVHYEELKKWWEYIEQVPKCTSQTNRQNCPFDSIEEGLAALVLDLTTAMELGLEEQV